MTPGSDDPTRTGRGNPATIWDYVDLALLSAAKRRRAKLGRREDAAGFYGSFFTADDAEQLHSQSDRRRSCREETLRQALRTVVPGEGRILDVGCGVGDNLRALRGLGASVIGMEYSGGAAAVAARLGGGDAPVLVGSATAIPVREQSIDVVVCLEVLEHIFDEAAALQEMRRVLKPGGHLVISVPYRSWFPSYVPLMGHMRHYTRAELEELLARHGFSTLTHLPNFPGWWRCADYVYVLCRALAGLGRLLGMRTTATSLRFGVLKKPLSDVLLGRFEWLRRREADLPYSTLGTSTFIVAARG